jgi:hypothetical protein
MIPLKVTKAKKDKKDYGLLYIVQIEIEDKSLVKIGVTTRTIEERVAEILVSIFKQYRKFPAAYPKRFREVGKVYEKEAILHEYFKSCRYKPQKVFSGSTEFFDISLDEAVDAYEELLAGDNVNASGQTKDEDS